MLPNCIRVSLILGIGINPLVGIGDEEVFLGWRLWICKFDVYLDKIFDRNQKSLTTRSKDACQLNIFCSVCLFFSSRYFFGVTFLVFGWNVRLGEALQRQGSGVEYHRNFHMILDGSRWLIGGWGRFAGLHWTSSLFDASTSHKNPKGPNPQRTESQKKTKTKIRKRERMFFVFQKPIFQRLLAS